MQVKVEEKGALSRLVTVTIPAEQLSEEIDRRLERLARTSKIRGFRPGKAPAKVVRQRYGSAVREDVVDELTRSEYAQAIADQKLSPVDLPTFLPGTTEADGSYTFSAQIDVFPEFELSGESGLVLKKPKVEILEQDVDAVLERLQKQRGEWQQVDRAAAEGDRVIIDFMGTIEGEPFDGNSATEFPVVIGADQLISGFEDGLTGISAGETRTLDLAFPDEYQKKELAGKPVRFEIKAHRVEHLELPALDEAFAAQFEIAEGGVDELRRRVRENMNAELTERIRSDLIDQVGDALLEANPIDVPKKLVDREIERQQRNTLRRLGIPSDDGRAPQLPTEPYQAESEKRVRLGLILSKLIEREALRPDPARVEQRIEGLSQGTNDPTATARELRLDRESMRGIEAGVLEDMAYDWLIEKSTVNDGPPKAFFEYMEPGEEQGQRGKSDE